MRPSRPIFPHRSGGASAEDGDGLFLAGCGRSHCWRSFCWRTCLCCGRSRSRRLPLHSRRRRLHLPGAPGQERFAIAPAETIDENVRAAQLKQQTIEMIKQKPVNFDARGTGVVARGAVMNALGQAPHDGTRKAAILLSLLGEEPAATILRNLPEGDLERITDEVATWVRYRSKSRWRCWRSINS